VYADICWAGPRQVEVEGWPLPSQPLGLKCQR